MSETDLLNVIAFCALMEGNGGIVNKSPDYVQEKYERYLLAKGEEYKWGLDGPNSDKLRSYIDTWLKSQDH